MRANVSKPLILVDIYVLVVALIYSPSATFSVLNRSNEVDATCTPTGKETAEGLEEVECCWFVRVPPGTGNPDLGAPGSSEEYCSTCGNGGTRGYINCSDPELQFLVGRAPAREVLPGDTGVLERPPTPQPFDPAAPLQGGVFEEPPVPPSSGGLPWLSEDIPTLEQSPPPQTVTPQEEGGATEPPVVPVCQEGLEFNEDLGFCVPTECPEGQELNEETDICVLEEQQPAAAEEQPSEDSNSEDNENN